VAKRGVLDPKVPGKRRRPGTAPRLVKAGAWIAAAMAALVLAAVFVLPALQPAAPRAPFPAAIWMRWGRGELLGWSVKPGGARPTGLGFELYGDEKSLRLFAPPRYGPAELQLIRLGVWRRRSGEGRRYRKTGRSRSDSIDRKWIEFESVDESAAR
jgi:hypothetical protein